MKHLRLVLPVLLCLCGPRALAGDLLVRLINSSGEDLRLAPDPVMGLEGKVKFMVTGTSRPVCYDLDAESKEGEAVTVKADETLLLCGVGQKEKLALHFFNLYKGKATSTLVLLVFGNRVDDQGEWVPSLDLIQPETCSNPDQLFTLHKNETKRGFEIKKNPKTPGCGSCVIL